MENMLDASALSLHGDDAVTLHIKG